MLPSSSANMLVMETEVRRKDRASSDIRCGIWIRTWKYAT